MGKRIINIMNFVRASEPRLEMDLITPIIEEIKLNKKYNFPNTFLLQYDALVSDEILDIFKREKDDNMELGVWFECVRQLVEACGLEWRGDPDITWDWHVVPGFLLAYTQDERRLLIDELMRKFREVFGYYPKTVASWMLDSWSVDYMTETYDVKMFGICREQFGVDAYSLWGGYFNQGYYPSKKNILCPAQTEENRVKAPVFRLLGTDPIYNYTKEYSEQTECATLEPVWKSGYVEKSVDAQFGANFEEECMGFGYVTLGQENSFGWEAIKKGLPMQFEKIDKLQREGKVTIEKMCETGEWFQNTYKENPAVSLISQSDWLENGFQSVWYNSASYRANLFLDQDWLQFRDINKFDENYEDRYLVTPCETWNAVQDNLPVVDGRLWSSDDIRSGLKFAADVSTLTTRKENDTLVCEAESAEGNIRVVFHEKNIEVCKPAAVRMFFERGDEADTKIQVLENALALEHNNYTYEVKFDCPLTKTEHGYELGEGKETVYIQFA